MDIATFAKVQSVSPHGTKHSIKTIRFPLSIVSDFVQSIWIMVSYLATSNYLLETICIRDVLISSYFKVVVIFCDRAGFVAPIMVNCEHILHLHSVVVFWIQIHCDVEN